MKLFAVLLRLPDRPAPAGQAIRQMKTNLRTSSGSTHLGAKTVANDAAIRSGRLIYNGTVFQAPTEAIAEGRRLRAWA